MNVRTWAKHAALAAALLGAPAIMWAADSAPLIEWKAIDIAGKAVVVPAQGKTSILLFVMADQSRSKDALAVVKEALAPGLSAEVVVIVSGDQAKAHAAVIAGQCPWPVVADGEYAASGKLGVRVWPTTVVVGADGKQIAHLAGIPKSFSRDLESYLTFAAGKIDAATFEHRLASTDAVVDSPEQIAWRHLQVAQRLIDKGLTSEARGELAAGLKLHPDSAPLRMALARVLLDAGEDQEAAVVLEKVPDGSIPGGQLDLLRGITLAHLGKWDQAKESLIRAIKLNPQPSEAWYQLGLVYQHQTQWKESADAFRRAFETTDQGRKVAATRMTER